MNPNDVAGVILGVTFFLVSGGVILLRPLSRRLGDLLEAIAAQKRQSVGPVELARLQQSLDQVQARLATLEERQGFTESLLSSGGRRAELLPAEPAPGAVSRPGSTREP
jgi:hypothetical protein